MEIEELIVEATKGNKTALEGVVAAIQEDIYYLALRMLANPENAKDATQEILIKAITNLSSFRFESQFKTWVFRIAANHLVSAKKILKKDPGLTFDLYKQDLECDLQEPSYLQDDPEYPILLNELCISCTMAMLLCLNPAHRITYIFGDIFEMGHVEASKILSISKENIRKQLSRARSKIIEFTSNSCGFVNSHAKCSCENKLTGAIMRKRVSRDSICFASDAQYSYNEVQESLQVTQQDLKTLALQTSINHYKCPIKLSAIIESLVA
ncbi:MAG: RNA polymerase sigma factor, partial [Exilibacterium sp.]